MTLQKISISNKCCSFKSNIHGFHKNMKQQLFSTLHIISKSSY